MSGQTVTMPEPERVSSRADCATLPSQGVKDVLIACCDGLKGLPDAITATWPQATVQASSVQTPWWRDRLAGHRATGRGPMQTRALEALMQTCPSRWRRAA